jgi:hypothetical protein
MGEFECKGDHSKHLCELGGTLKNNYDRLNDYKKLIDHPKYVCFNCGRAANLAENLCNPQPI